MRETGEALNLAKCPVPLFTDHILQMAYMAWILVIVVVIKTMTNLDGILKSRDISLPIKVYLVKAMLFPVVMYGCES